MPSTYSLFLTNQAKKELTKINKGAPKIAQAIAHIISQIQNNPNLGESLHGDLKGRLKVRVGNYRIVYSVNRNNLVINILRVAHRKDAYR